MAAKGSIGTSSFIMPEGGIPCLVTRAAAALASAAIALATTTHGRRFRLNKSTLVATLVRSPNVDAVTISRGSLTAARRLRVPLAALGRANLRFHKLLDLLLARQFELVLRDEQLVRQIGQRVLDQGVVLARAEQ